MRGLRLLRDQLQDAINESENKEEAAPYNKALKAIKDAEKDKRNGNRELKQKQFELEIKIAVKKFGPEDETADARGLLTLAEKEHSVLEKLP